MVAGGGGGADNGGYCGSCVFSVLRILNIHRTAQNDTWTGWWGTVVSYFLVAYSQ